jgi:hypothetical protein
MTATARLCSWPRACSQLAERYGRDLADPFGAVDDSPAEPPWLDTRFVLGARRHRESPSR